MQCLLFSPLLRSLRRDINVRRAKFLPHPISLGYGNMYACTILLLSLRNKSSLANTYSQKKENKKEWPSRKLEQGSLPNTTNASKPTALGYPVSTAPTPS